MAWKVSRNEFERIIAAHYVVRHVGSMIEKLERDKKDLEFALKLDEEKVGPMLSSLHLNIGKCHEKLGHTEEAVYWFKMAESFVKYLGSDEYGKLIRYSLALKLK